MADWDINEEESKNILKGKSNSRKDTPKKQGRPKVENSRKNKVICYFSDDEIQEVKEFCDGRPASVVLRSIILDNIRGK